MLKPDGLSHSNKKIVKVAACIATTPTKNHEAVSNGSEKITKKNLSKQSWQNKILNQISRTENSHTSSLHVPVLRPLRPTNKKHPATSEYFGGEGVSTGVKILLGRYKNEI